MKAAIYNPYLDSLGGGERYSMAVASFFVNNGYQVDVEWKNPEIKEQLEKRFGIVLNGVNFISDVKKGSGYDVCFWISDGSIPLLRARKNILHFQIPFHGVSGESLINKMKFMRINKIVCNSQFTKKVIDKEYGVVSSVIFPPVSIEKFRSKRKENLILYVGRFSQLKQSKRQDILIKAFKKLYMGGLKDYKLVLAGGVEVGSGEFVEELESQIFGFPIKIVKSPSFGELKDLYSQAKFFWSAAGYERNEKKEPEQVEHFGISVVEAMASGAIPLVYNAGGFKEIIKDRESGYLWKGIGDLLSITKKLAEEGSLLREISKKCKERSKAFSYDSFYTSFERLIA